MISIKLTALALAAVTIGSTPAFAHDPVEGARYMDHEIGMCVAEVGKQADYSGARRVVHKVVDIEQKMAIGTGATASSAASTRAADSAATTSTATRITTWPS